MAKLPIYEMIINPEENSEIEVSFVALVEKPAIERNFLAFDTNRVNFSINEEKRIISGPAMVADLPIYRRDENGEYNVFFSPETIKQIALKFFKKDYHKNLNLFHDPGLSLEGVTIFESFVTDKDRGIKPMKGFEDLPDGSWFISAKIDNEQVWQKIKSGEVKGFSVEGIFSYIKKQKSTEEKLSELLSETIFSDCHLNETELMSTVKDMLVTLKQKFLGEPAPVPAPAPNPAPTQVLNTDYQLKDGTAITVDKLESGGVVLIAGAPAPAGQHELADGTKITVGEGGVITEVMAASQAAPEPPADYSKQFGEITERFNSFEQRFTQQSDTINQLSQSFAKQNEMLSNLVDIVGKLAETPTADPVGEPKPGGFNSDKAASKSEQRQKLVESFKKLKTA